MRMLLSRLSKEELSFIKKCIIRLHKEHGTYYFFKKHRRGQYLHKDVPLVRHAVYLLWDIFVKVLGRNTENNLLSSTYQLELIDLLSKYESENLKILCKEIAVTEFSFIECEMENMDSEGIQRLSKETINKINMQYEKYADLLPKNSFKYLPITR